MRGRNNQSSSDRVLQATFACVARYGIAKTSVEDVARELDWEQLLGHIDLDQILATHGR